MNAAHRSDHNLDVSIGLRRLAAVVLLSSCELVGPRVTIQPQQPEQPQPVIVKPATAQTPKREEPTPKRERLDEIPKRETFEERKERVLEEPQKPTPDRMPDEVVVKVIEAGRAGFGRCFKKASDLDPYAAFKVRLHVELDPQGRVTTINADTTNAALASCLVRVGSGLPYPMTGRTVVVDLPLFYRRE